MDIKNMIDEAHKNADEAIEKAQENATVWYRKPCKISNGQAALVVLVALIAILAF